MKVEHFGQVNMMYSCITVLRALALREGSQKIWKEYTQFESHLEERMPTPIYSKVSFSLFLKNKTEKPFSLQRGQEICHFQGDNKTGQIKNGVARDNK